MSVTRTLPDTWFDTVLRVLRLNLFQKINYV